ncbi:TniB family NTP-binding protein [Bradyrhizobium barranii subsp. barranii]|uniref:AAA family ATPase n=1 Tax=Bradyrhizobium barranii subsp. barranii TaxID=2823807 RepID=A0A7Z0Q771_9BRAD|nr:AAA family ATPase [Bradyrhizobium barranii]UGX94811.1 TniB family NTP-binding protein [Bradyrhizobium barranii subsp. barranii]
MRKVAKRIYHIARAKGTVLLVIDEAHEMLRHDGGKVGRQMASLLKVMVNECVFSILLVGTEDLKPLFKSLEVLNRSLPDDDCDLRPFDITKRADCEYFFPFLKMLEDRLVEDGVVDRPLGWVDSVEDCARIYDMSGGILGTPCRVLFMALDRAFRAGRPHLKWDDISKAFVAYNQLRPENERTFDPFVKGPRTESVATLSRMLT